MPHRPRAARMFVLVVMIAAAAVTAAAATPAALAAALPTGAADAVLIAPHAYASADALVAAVEATGARADIVYAPLAVVAQASADAATQLTTAGFTVLRGGDPVPPGAPAETARGLALLGALHSGALRAQAASVAAKAQAAAAGTGPAGPQLGNDLRTPGAGASLPQVPLLPGLHPSGLLGALPDASDGVVYAYGTVTVSIVFTQCDGSDSNFPKTEDWSNPDGAVTDRREAVLERVDMALEWWVQRAAENHYTARPGLTFVVPAAGQPGAPQTVGTHVEPINWYTYDPTDPKYSDWLWRKDVMGALGYPEPSDDWPPSEFAYSDWLRQQTGSTWAFTLYVVDSLNKDRATGGNALFADGSVAYTYDIFGPYVVLTYTNDGYGADHFSDVLAHEMGHVFGALDEYWPTEPGYPSTGNLTSGYLGVKNSNAQEGGTTDVACIMRGGWDSMSAFAAGKLCTATRGQDGWRDSDRDGSPDPLDTHPLISDQPQVTGGDGSVTVAGSVSEVPWPRGKMSFGSYFSHDISIQVPHDAQFSVDGGVWQPLAANDGTWDQASEAFSLTTAPLTTGPHTLRLQAATGSASSLARVLWVGDVPVSLALAGPGGSHSLVTTWGHTVALSLAATSGGVAVPHLPGVAWGPVGVPAAARTATLDGNGRLTINVAPQVTTTYVANFATTGQFIGPASSPAVKVGVRAALIVKHGSVPLKWGRTLKVWGLIRPGQPSGQVSLYASRDGGRTWHFYSSTRIVGGTTFVLGYRSWQPGAVRLRVLFRASRRSLGNSVDFSFKVVR